MPNPLYSCPDIETVNSKLFGYKQYVVDKEQMVGGEEGKQKKFQKGINDLKKKKEESEEIVVDHKLDIKEALTKVNEVESFMKHTVEVIDSHYRGFHNPFEIKMRGLKEFKI